MMRTDVLIVGAGFAGAATAYHLSQSFSGSVLLVDQEEVPGFHASGRNASLILQSTELPEVRQAIALSRRFYAANQQELGFQQCGSLLLGEEDQLAKTRAPDLIFSEYKNQEAAGQQIPILENHSFQAALWTPSDGVIDISNLLQFFLRQARGRGAQLLLQCQVRDIRRQGAYKLATSAGAIEATYLINAAGAWAPKVSQMAGASTLPLSPLKRHLFVLGDVPGVRPDWPFVWNLQRSFYFRPESGDLLFSLCDEERTDHLSETVSPEISQSLAELIWQELPALRDAVQKRVWSCFRTKTGDGRFVIGWDPRLENFFWVAGLAGHGVGAAWEVGRLAAAKFLGREETGAAPFDPARFIDAATGALRDHGV